MYRRRFLHHLIAATAGTSVLVAAGRAQTPSPERISKLQLIRERGTLRIGTTGDFQPMSFRDPNSGNYRGFDIDAMSELAADLGVRREFIQTDWGKFIPSLIAGRFDVFSGASVTETRARQIAFSAPYFEFSTLPVVSKAAAIRLKSWDDMNATNVRVAVTAGTAFEEQARAHFPKARIIVVAPPGSGYQEVVSGLADVTLTSNVEAAELLKRFGSLTLTEASATPRNRRPAAFAVAPSDRDLLDFVDAWVGKMSKEGFFATLEKKWLSKPV